MTTRAAVPRLLPILPVPRSSDRATTPDPLAEISLLRAALKSATVRLASYADALNRVRQGEQCMLEYSAYVGRSGSLGALCGMAEACERDGRVPALRFRRNGTHLVGVELAVLPVPHEADPGGMSVIAGDEVCA